VALVVLASVLLLTNLGGEALWEDEGDTAVLARTILQSGVPTAWDGVAFLDPDYGQRLTEKLVMVSHPWLQYYLAAASFAVLGESVVAARLPFALAGAATVALVYALGVMVLRRRSIAVVAGVLLTVSVQFLLFARQARNYPVHALLTCAVIWCFLRLDSWRRSALLAALGILLFHTHPGGLVTFGALGLATLVVAECRRRQRWYWPAAVVVGAYAIPWTLMSRAGYGEAATAPTSVVDVGHRLAQFLVEYASVTPLVALVLCGAALWWTRRSRSFTPDERGFAGAAALVIAGQMSMVIATQSPVDIWILGLHHTPALLPLTMVLVAMALVHLSGGRRFLVALSLVILAFTRFGQLGPWVAWAEPTAEPVTGHTTFHVPPERADRFLRTTQLQFLRGLMEPNPGTISHVATYLRQHARTGDVVLTNAESQALYFHTRLPLAAKVSESFPIHRAARDYGLPEYVFGHEGVRWIVWRRAFPAYFPDQDIAAVLQRFAAIGIRTELVATVPETVFENRENVHFRRYPGSTYVFPWHSQVQDALVYRVHWPVGPDRWLVEGNSHYLNEDYAGAIPFYERVVLERPDDADALSRLGTSYALLGRLDEGIDVLRRAVEASPGDGVSALALASAFFDKQDATGAERWARRAMTLLPRDAGAADLLGRALAVQGRLQEALVFFERAVALNPGADAARTNAARVRQLMQGRHPFPDVVVPRP